MKKTYQKPLATKRETLTAVTAKKVIRIPISWVVEEKILP